MATERRKNRTPYSYRSQSESYFGIFNRDGVPIGMVFSVKQAQFICLACNTFDRLVSLLHACRSEYEELPDPHARPAYRDLLQVSEEIEDARKR